ncbi:MAG TPA: hypothetical protein VFF30_00545 [Nitrososphaerales archaeon]|nr:hypothetical protein [Nitrososphaerales archaeon]
MSTTENSEYMNNSQPHSESFQQQQVASVEFEVMVKDWWIEGGRLVIPKEYRQYFPKPGEPIVLIDYEGRMYRSKIHNLWQGVDVGRIDGIKPFYRNHPIITPGAKLHIKVTGKSTAVVMLGERATHTISR